MPPNTLQPQGPSHAQKLSLPKSREGTKHPQTPTNIAFSEGLDLLAWRNAWRHRAELCGAAVPGAGQPLTLCSQPGLAEPGMGTCGKPQPCWAMLTPPAPASSTEPWGHGVPRFQPLLFPGCLPQQPHAPANDAQSHGESPAAASPGNHHSFGVFTGTSPISATSRPPTLSWVLLSPLPSPGRPAPLLPASSPLSPRSPQMNPSPVSRGGI